MHVNIFITNNYKWLIRTAQNITARNKQTKLKYDLVSVAVECVIKSGKYIELPEDEFKLLFATILKNQYVWKQGSEFWKHYYSLNQYVSTESKEQEADNQFIDILSTCKEKCDEDKELMTFYNDISIEKIKHVRDFEQSLPTHEKVLFDLYINQQLSLSKIAKEINIPKPSVFLMVRDLKNKILESWEMKCS